MKARARGGTTTKIYIGFLMGSNPDMSSKVDLEHALTSFLQDNINDPEVSNESKKVKEFNLITKKVFDANAWHVYVNKEEAREVSKLLLAHLASDHLDKALGIRGCKLVPGSKNITPESVKMYCIQEQNRVMYTMTTVVVKNIYPVDIYYSNSLSLSGLFQGDVISEDDTTKMRQILDAKLNAPDPSNSWDLDVVHDIFYRQGMLHIDCQSEHVKLLTSRLTGFLESLIEATSEADLTTVCGIRDYNPNKNPEVEFISNYSESGIKQVELTTSAPSDIDMDLLQKLISDQKLAKYEGPVQPTTCNRAPKATYHPRGREPIELDNSSAESATV